MNVQGLLVASVLVVGTLASDANGASVVLHVNAGRSTSRNSFLSVASAVAHARKLSGPPDLHIVIKIAPGSYSLSETLRLDIPNLTLRGSNEPQVDADGWPTGELSGGTETSLIATPALGAAPLVLIEADGVTVRNLSLSRPDAKDETLAVKFSRAFVVRNCTLIGPAMAAVSTAASSGIVAGNYIRGASCGACLAGGNAEWPAVVEFTGNRSVGNGNGALLLSGGITLERPGIFNSLRFTALRNDLSGNRAMPRFSFGIRMFSLRREPPDPFMQNDGHVRGTIAHNRIAGNEFGVIVDAGFPYRTSGGVADDRQYTGTMDVSFHDNEIHGNAVPALIAFTRFTASINPSTLTPSPGNSWKYLLQSRFNISDPDLSLAGYWLDHPHTDPVDGRVLLNTLIMNGVEIMQGREGLP